MVKPHLFKKIVLSLLFLGQFSSFFVLSFYFSLLFYSELRANVTLNKPIVLTPQKVADRVMEENLKVQETNLNSEQNRSIWTKAMAPYDYQISLENGYEVSRFENFQGTANLEDTLSKTVLSFKKPFTTGTILGVEYTLNHLTSIYPGSSTSTIPNNQYQNILGATFEQNLWRNYFGEQDRAQIKSAQYNYKAQMMSRKGELQDHVLDGLRLFWKTYVAQETFKEAVHSRDRTENLVGVVKRKNSFGYSIPGELPQIEAELEGRVQNVQIQSAAYLNALDRLLAFLQLPPNTEVEFLVSHQIPSIPVFASLSIDELRVLRAQKMKVESAQQALLATESQQKPVLNLVGKLYSSGIQESASEAFTEMSSKTHPKYYVGINFSYSFGSHQGVEEVRTKRTNIEIEHLKWTRQKQELQNQIDEAVRKVQTTYNLANSIKRQIQMREKASQELQRSYSQGRTDMSVFIDAMNKYFNSLVQYISSVGDYQIALNELAAVRDELITGEKGGMFDEIYEKEQ